MTREELIARLEAATGADRELDGWIYLAVKGEQGFEPPWRHKMFSDNLDEWARTGEINRVANNYKIPSYTASLDTALTLVPEGWAKDIWLKRHSGYHWQATLHIPSHERDGRHREAPIAICIAALKASAQP